MVKSARLWISRGGKANHVGKRKRRDLAVSQIFQTLDQGGNKNLEKQHRRPEDIGMALLESAGDQSQKFRKNKKRQEQLNKI
jgi:hypothetical protein